MFKNDFFKLLNQCQSNNTKNRQNISNRLTIRATNVNFDDNEYVRLNITIENDEEIFQITRESKRREIDRKSFVNRDFR